MTTRSSLDSETPLQTQGAVPSREYSLLSREYSLCELANREADDHKWWSSEQLGFDAGPDARGEWCRQYWRKFCRYRRVDHLMGRRRIREFDVNSFGQLCDSKWIEQPVVQFVLKHFAEDGWENLHFLVYAPDRGFSLPELREVLMLVDVNSARFDPPHW